MRVAQPKPASSPVCRAPSAGVARWPLDQPVAPRESAPRQRAIFLSLNTDRFPTARLFENEPNIALAEDAAEWFERDRKLGTKFGGALPALAGPEPNVAQRVGLAIIGTDSVDVGPLDFERE